MKIRLTLGDYKTFSIVKVEVVLVNQRGHPGKIGDTTQRQARVFEQLSGVKVQHVIWVYAWLVQKNITKAAYHLKSSEDKYECELSKASHLERHREYVGGRHVSGLLAASPILMVD